MAVDTASYSPLQIIAGDADLRAKQVTIAASAGALVGIANSGSTQKAYVYTHGDFWADQIGWGATLLALVTTDDKKDQVFDQSGINIKFSGNSTMLQP